MASNRNSDHDSSVRTTRRPLPFEQREPDDEDSQYKNLATTADPSECTCPIHGDLGDPGPELIPKGVDFEANVDVVDLDLDTINEIYRTHHSYRDGLASKDQFTDGQHGITHRGELCGAITYNAPNFPKISFYFEPDGRIHRDDDLASNNAVQKTIVGDWFAHVARICIGVDFPNLASCGFCRSQERFIERTDKDVGFLVTYIRGDHSGSMVKALRDKGWSLAGFNEGSKSPSNRDHQSIHDTSKARWVRPVDDSVVKTVRQCPCTDDMLIMKGKSHVCGQCNAWHGSEGHSWAPSNPGRVVTMGD